MDAPAASASRGAPRRRTPSSPPSARGCSGCSMGPREWRGNDAPSVTATPAYRPVLPLALFRQKGSPCRCNMPYFARPEGAVRPPGRPDHSLPALNGARRWTLHDQRKHIDRARCRVEPRRAGDGRIRTQRIMKPRLPRSYDKPAGTMVLGLDVVLAAKPEAKAERSNLRPPDLALLDLADGKRTIEEILQLSQTSWFVAMRRLRSLCERGILGPIKSSEPPSGKHAAGNTTLPGPGAMRSPRAEDLRPRTVDLTDVVGKLLIPTGGTPGTAATSTTPGFTPAAPRREAGQ